MTFELDTYRSPGPFGQDGDRDRYRLLVKRHGLPTLQLYPADMGGGDANARALLEAVVERVNNADANALRAENANLRLIIEMLHAESKAETEA